MAFKALCTGVFCLALLSGAAEISSKPISMDIYQDELSQESAETLWALKNPNSKTIPEFQQKHFWFYNFTVGEGTVKSVVDTASFDVIVLEKKLYHPSPKSQNLHHSFKVGFATTHPDGTGMLTARGKLYRDIVGVPSVTSPDQILGVVTERKPSGPRGHLAGDPEGILGLSSSSTQFNVGSSRGWFRSLCVEKKVSECRFGLAFGTNKKGKQILGGIDHSLFEGNLTKVQLAMNFEWYLLGDVTVNNLTLRPNILFYSDSGTTTIVGPEKDVAIVFRRLGITPFRSGKSLRGTYPCNKKLRPFGFRFPGSGMQGDGPNSPISQIFNVDESAMAFQNLGNGTCIAALEGIDSFNQRGTWLVGQAFFQGLYIDHNAEDRTMGFAHLKSLSQ